MNVTRYHSIPDPVPHLHPFCHLSSNDVERYLVQIRNFRERLPQIPNMGGCEATKEWMSKNGTGSLYWEDELLQGMWFCQSLHCCTDTEKIHEAILQARSEALAKSLNETLEKDRPVAKPTKRSRL